MACYLGRLKAVTLWINVSLSKPVLCGEVGIRVGMRVGRYLEDPVLVGAVAEHVLGIWLGNRKRLTELSLTTVEEFWNEYTKVIESEFGEVELVRHDELRRAWAEHAQRLLEAKMASPLDSAISLVQPQNLDADR
jgi:hypothetical protein